MSRRRERKAKYCELTARSLCAAPKSCAIARSHLPNPSDATHQGGVHGLSENDAKKTGHRPSGSAGNADQVHKDQIKGLVRATFAVPPYRVQALMMSWTSSG